MNHTNIMRSDLRNNFLKNIIIRLDFIAITEPELEFIADNKLKPLYPRGNSNKISILLASKKWDKKENAQTSCNQRIFRFV